MVDETAEFKQLHAAYQNATGMLDLQLSMQRIYQWQLFKAAGYTAEDVWTVANLLKSKIRRQEKTVACLRFSTMIGNLEWFGEDLAEAQALARNAKNSTPRDNILTQTGRQADSRAGFERLKQPGLADSVQAGESVKALQSDPVRVQAALDELRKLRDSL